MITEGSSSARLFGTGCNMGAETSKLQEATEEVKQEIEQQAAVQEVSDVVIVA